MGDRADFIGAVNIDHRDAPLLEAYFPHSGVQQLGKGPHLAQFVRSYPPLPGKPDQLHKDMGEDLKVFGVLLHQVVEEVVHG